LFTSLSGKTYAILAIVIERRSPMVSETEARSTTIMKQFLPRATETAGYIALVMGYLISIFSANYLTLTNVLAFTATQLLYAFVFLASDNEKQYT